MGVFMLPITVKSNDLFSPLDNYHPILSSFQTQLLTPEVISVVEELKKTVKKDTKAVCKRIVLLTQM